MAQVYKLSRLLDNNVTKSKWYRWCWINYSLRCSFFWFFVIRSPPFFPLSTILVIRAHSLRSWRRLNVFISIARDLFYLSFHVFYVWIVLSPSFCSPFFPPFSFLITPFLLFPYPTLTCLLLCLLPCFCLLLFRCLLALLLSRTFIMLSFRFSSIFSAHLTFNTCTGARADHVSSPIRYSD